MIEHFSDKFSDVALFEISCRETDRQTQTDRQMLLRSLPSRLPSTWVTIVHTPHDYSEHTEQ